MAFAYCDRKGVILIGVYTPKGMLQLGKGKANQLEETVSGLCRLAYDGKTMLVPGIPEAETDEEALAAAGRFRDRLTASLAKRR